MNDRMQVAAERFDRAFEEMHRRAVLDLHESMEPSGQSFEARVSGSGADTTVTEAGALHHHGDAVDYQRTCRTFERVAELLEDGLSRIHGQEPARPWRPQRPVNE